MLTMRTRMMAERIRQETGAEYVVVSLTLLIIALLSLTLPLIKKTLVKLRSN